MPAGPPPSTTTSCSASICVLRAGSATNIQSDYAIEAALRSAGGRGRATQWQPLSALAAEARALCAVRDRMAGAMVGQGADAALPRRAQGGALAKPHLSRDVRRRP